MKKRIDNDKLIETLSFGLGSNAVSHNETTGLIPSRPLDEYELDSYHEINYYRQIPITNK